LPIRGRYCTGNKGARALLVLIMLFLSSISSVVDLSASTVTQAKNNFESCRKRKGEDCSYFKAILLERQGNAGSAMDLYFRGGYFDDYIRLKAVSGQDIEALIKKYKIGKLKEEYYRGILCFSKGKWNEARKTFSKRALSNYTPAKFYVAYAYVMLGKIKDAKKILDDKPSGLKNEEEIYYKKLEGIIVYAENKQVEALKLFLSILKKYPEDFIALKYSAHIYYRTGWFKKAEKIYSSLISKEWKDTEIYYLLSERCEMRVRYFKFDLAVKDAKKVISEFPQRRDFIPQFISWLLEYSNLALAKKYLNNLSYKEDKYQASLFYFAAGMIDDFELNDESALEKFKKADSIYPTKEYKQKIKEAKQNQISFPINDYPKLECKKFSISTLADGGLFVKSNIFGKRWPIRYLINYSGKKYFVNLGLVFKYPKDICFSSHKKLWMSFAEKTWSTDGMVLEISSFEEDTAPPTAITINVVPWPSAFYSQRTSSHKWNILNPPKVIAHEIGHLMGLDDEYYETDARIYKRTKNRFIGPRASIMRNVLSGKPQKMHIHFILSPIKCKN